MTKKKSTGQKNQPILWLILTSSFFVVVFASPSFLFAQEVNAKENTIANYAIDSILDAFSVTLANVPVADKVTSSTKTKSGETTETSSKISKAGGSELQGPHQNFVGFNPRQPGRNAELPNPEVPRSDPSYLGHGPIYEVPVSVPDFSPRRPATLGLDLDKSQFVNPTETVDPENPEVHPPTGWLFNQWGTPNPSSLNLSAVRPEPIDSMAMLAISELTTGNIKGSDTIETVAPLSSERATAVEARKIAQEAAVQESMRVVQESIRESIKAITTATVEEISKQATTAVVESVKSSVKENIQLNGDTLQKQKLSPKT